LPLRRLMRSTIAPLVPAAMRRLRHRAPAWIRPDVARRTGLEERLRTHPLKPAFQEAEADRILPPPVGLGLELNRVLEPLPRVGWGQARRMIAALLAGRPSDRMAIWRLVALQRWLMLRSGHQVTQEVPHETPVA